MAERTVWKWTRRKGSGMMSVAQGLQVTFANGTQVGKNKYDKKEKKRRQEEGEYIGKTKLDRQKQVKQARGNQFGER